MQALIDDRTADALIAPGQRHLSSMPSSRKALPAREGPLHACGDEPRIGSRLATDSLLAMQRTFGSFAGYRLRRRVEISHA